MFFLWAISSTHRVSRSESGMVTPLSLETSLQSMYIPFYNEGIGLLW